MLVRMSSTSGNHDPGRPHQLSTIPPEIPRRPAVTIPRPAATSTTASVTLTNGNATSLSPSISPANVPVRHERVREIHKNAWLKRLHTTYDKKGVPLVKRAEKWWTVFCVHDDVEAYLEFYSEPKMAQIHKPTARVSLTTCLHVSPSIVGQDNEFQFAVTLSSQVICLAAADWDQMLEWVESLQGKLREMNILSPKDNLYSKLPEVRRCPLVSGLGTISTRDPNSPLPPTPNGFMSTEFPTGVNPPPTTISVNDGHLLELFTPSTSVYIHPSGNSFPRVEHSGDGSGGGSILRIDTSLSHTSGIFNHSQNNNASFSAPCTDSRTPPTVVGTNNNATLVHIGFENPSDASGCSPSLSSNQNTLLSTVECSSNAPPSQKCSRRSKSRSSSRKCISDLGLSCDTVLSALSSNSAAAAATSSSSFFTATQPCSPAPDDTALCLESHATGTANSDCLYEHIFTTTEITNTQSPTSISNGIRVPPSIPQRNPRAKKTERRIPHASVECRLLSSQVTVEGIEVDGIQFTRNTGADSLVQNTVNPGSVRGMVAQARPLEGIVGRGDYLVQRNGIQGRAPKPEQSTVNDGASANTKVEATATHVPLKESQVMRLNLEINHASGVRISLRKKDCVDTIAFVDYLGAVWIAGWKQQEHPVLYYAFHVGDQVISLGGQKIQCSEEARKAVKTATSHQVEFIIRRLPHGRVFVLKRKVEGEPLGLVAVGNCSEISEVVPNSLAALAGLSPKATAADGQSTCNWVLTEINNRPLSLVARESEVKDRLNAVGKEISILVQPSDLVKHMKKQLKALKGFKEYLVV